MRLVRPDGVVESYSITTGGNGSGSYTFPHAATRCSAPTRRRSPTRARATAASARTTVSAAPQAAPPSDQLQCDPARSQLEAEQCAELRGNAPQDTPVPEDQLQCNPPRSQLEAEQCAALD